MKKSKCDFDCFNCKYDDCITDSSKSPYEKMHRIKKDDAVIDKKERDRIKAREYYKAHREECIAKASERYYRNRDEILRKKREKTHASKSK